MIDLMFFVRPNTTECLTHPFFWDPARRLAFLQDASDRFEIMCRDPRDADLVELEKNAFHVVGNDWQSRLDKIFLDNLGKFRKYDGKSVQDLMRALRNKVRTFPRLITSTYSNGFFVPRNTITKISLTTLNDTSDRSRMVSCNTSPDVSHISSCTCTQSSQEQTCATSPCSKVISNSQINYGLLHHRRYSISSSLSSHRCRFLFGCYVYLL